MSLQRRHPSAEARAAHRAAQRRHRALLKALDDARLAAVVAPKAPPAPRVVPPVVDSRGAIALSLLGGHVWR